MKILILAPYPLRQAPSQRFRFEHFLNSLTKNAISWNFQSFYSEKGWQNLYKEEALPKLLAVIGGFIRRLFLLGRLSGYEYVFVHRELAPFGPPIFEWLISQIFRKKVIYDFDDAIWMNDGHDAGMVWKMKWRSKIASICKWSWKVTVGNEFLADFAKNYNSNVIILPTVVDTHIHQPKTTKTKPQVTNHKLPTIGWTGSHSTLFYLDALLSILQKLQEEVDFEFLVIANKNPNLPLKNFGFIKWNKNTEVKDLSRMDIGVMPLEDNDWARGKCGFKLIQYLSMGIPAVASPVGVNPAIIIDGKTGYLANSPDEWFERIKTLLNTAQLREQMGQSGRELIIEKYSVQSQISNFLGLFNLSD